MISEKEKAEIDTWSRVFENDIKRKSKYVFNDNTEYVANSWFYLEHVLEIVWVEHNPTNPRRDKHIVNLASYIEGFPDSEIRKSGNIITVTI